MSLTKKQLYFLIIAGILLPVLCLVHLFSGQINIEFHDFSNSLFNYNNQDTNQIIVRELRIPRMLMAVIAGAGLSLAGLLMQTLFRNPLAGPSVLGITSGSTLGVALAVFALNHLGMSVVSDKITLSILAVIGALIVTFLLLIISKFVKKSNTLLIIGLMIGYFVSSVVNVFSFLSDKTELQSFVYWGLGSFDKEIEFSNLYFYYGVIVALIIVIFFLQKPLNLLLMGEKYAVSLGLRLGRIRLIVIAIVGLLVGVITALCGPIAFLGIATPHLARNFIKKSDHKWVIPFTLVLGASLGLVCDIISRLPGFALDLPLNAVTSFIGAPIVVWIIFKNKMV